MCHRTFLNVIFRQMAAAFDAYLRNGIPIDNFVLTYHDDQCVYDVLYQSSSCTQE